MRIPAAGAVAAALALTACGDEQASARFERVEDRAEYEYPNLEDCREPTGKRDPGDRHGAPLHVDEDQEAAPPPPEEN